VSARRAQADGSARSPEVQKLLGRRGGKHAASRAAPSPWALPAAVWRAPGPGPAPPGIQLWRWQRDNTLGAPCGSGSAMSCSPAGFPPLARIQERLLMPTTAGQLPATSKLRQRRRRLRLLRHPCRWQRVAPAGAPLAEGEPLLTRADKYQQVAVLRPHRRDRWHLHRWLVDIELRPRSGLQESPRRRMMGRGE